MLCYLLITFILGCKTKDVCVTSCVVTADCRFKIEDGYCTTVQLDAQPADPDSTAAANTPESKKNLFYSLLRILKTEGK